jgi:hypothetical protein
MASSGWQQALLQRKERFPTEWAPCYEDDADGEWPILPRVLEDMKAELVCAVQQSLGRLVWPDPAAGMENLRARLRSLEEALRAFQEERFWDCTDCDDESSVKRLRAVLCRLAVLLASQEPAPSAAGIDHVHAS